MEDKRPSLVLRKPFGFKYIGRGIFNHKRSGIFPETFFDNKNDASQAAYSTQ